MKIRVLVPELTFSGKKHRSGDTFTISDTDREGARAVAKLARSGYVAVDGAEAGTTTTPAAEAPRRSTTTKEA